MKYLFGIIFLSITIFCQTIPLVEQDGISLISSHKNGMHSYFDICPESPNGEKIIYYTFDGNIPGNGYVIVADRNGGNPEIVSQRIYGSTHDAVRQMWISDSVIAYSSFNWIQTFLVNINTNESRTIKGELLNYSQATGLGLTVADTEINGIDTKVILKMNIETGELDTLIKINDLASIHPEGDELIDNKYANLKQPKWSPDGEHLIFKLKAKDKKGGSTIAKSIFVADKYGNNIKYLDDKVNHAMWYDNNTAYGYDKKDDVVLYSIDGEENENYWYNALGIHGSVNGSGKLFVTDLFDYPSSERGLIILYDSQEDSYIKIAEMNMPPVSDDDRVHPHPVWSRDYSRIYFNSEDSGIRKLYAYDLPDSIISSLQLGVYEKKPYSISLSNYPNPFNSKTTIVFRIPDVDYVGPEIAVMKIFNLLGAEVELLLDKVLLPGTHSVNYDASRLASGIYLLQFSLGNRSISRKINLLK